MIPSATRSCSVVIATLDRVDSLRTVFKCLARQTRLPEEVIVVVAGESGPVDALSMEREWPFSLRIISSSEKSSARQRNQGAEMATGNVLAFLDDDIEFSLDLFSKILASFDFQDSTQPGAIAARIAEENRPPPGRLVRLYYRLQAGFPDQDYGGRLFGPGINCYPVYSQSSNALLESDWLPATCLFVDALLFQQERFPEFQGYSYAEDVHLTARIKRHAPIYFDPSAVILHHSLTSEFKQDATELVYGKLRNMGVVARDILGLRGLRLSFRMALHRLFMTAVLLIRRPPRWRDQIRGCWLHLLRNEN